MENKLLNVLCPGAQYTVTQAITVSILPSAFRDFKDRVCFHVVSIELHIGTHKMVSNRTPKCKSPRPRTQ